MNQMSQTHLISFLIPALLIAATAVVGVWVGTSIYSRYTGLARGPSALLYLLAVGLAVWLVVELRDFIQHAGNGGMDHFFTQLPCIILLPLLAVPFVTRLYRKWIGGHLTPAEKLPDIDGVRAWLGVGNIICAALIPLCVWVDFNYSPLAVAALTFGLLLAYPLLNMASHPAQTAPAGLVEDLSSEREKVLQLLEAGKINAVESAELLNALSQSVPPPPPPVAEINAHRKMVLLGAALLLAGFFLPWFSLDPNAMVNDLAAQFQQSMGGLMSANVMPHINLPGGTVQIRAGDLAHGLGWWVLALGLGAAVLPFFATTLAAGLQKKIILAALGVGVVLLIYLLSDAIKYVSYGILLVLAGYALEVVGTLKERPAAV